MNPEENEQTVMQEAPKKKDSALVELYSLLHDMVYILAVICVVFLFAVRLVGVNGDSMFSTLHNNDFLVLQNRLLTTSYQYGDIIVATVPSFSTSEPIVKRVIATEGQTVDIHYDLNGIGRVSVDGKELEETYINEPMNLNKCADMDRHVVVPEGQIFVMGDNRNHSADSRIIGCVDVRYVLGKVQLIVFPGDNSDGLHDGGAREWSRIGTVGKSHE